MKGKKLITIISIVCILAVMLCVPAFATVTESDGNGYALYGGVKLPDIDSVWSDELLNPYAWIYVNDGIYYFTFGEVDIFIFSDNIAYARGLGSFQTYRFDVSSYTWEFVRSYISTKNREVRFINDSTRLYLSRFVWSNLDLSNDDYSIIRFNSSTPISLDGYNIIEWDGDTTGITEISLGFYKLAPYEFAVDAFAVWNGDTRSVQTTYVAESPVWAVQSYGSTGAADGDAIVVGNDGTLFGDLVFDGIGALKNSDYYVSLIAYRTTETPPDEGGGDDPDDPQPPTGG